jgi:hypothetical protein
VPALKLQFRFHLSLAQQEQPLALVLLQPELQGLELQLLEQVLPQPEQRRLRHQQ